VTGRELIAALERLPEEFKDSEIVAEHRELRGPLDVEGIPVEESFYSVRVDTHKHKRRKVYTIVLF